LPYAGLQTGRVGFHGKFWAKGREKKCLGEKLARAKKGYGLCSDDKEVLKEFIYQLKESEEQRWTVLEKFTGVY
jgi:hypothetical protein